MSVADRLPLVVEREDGLRLRLLSGLEFDRRQLAVIAVALVFLLLLPDIVSLVGLSFPFVLKGLTFGIAALGVNLLLRHTQLVSFGHAAFFGAGAYGAAVLASYGGVDSGIVLLLGAALVGTLAAVVIGFLVAGHREIYFALLTLAFGQLMFAIVIGSQFFNFDDGLSVRVDGERASLLGVDRMLDVGAGGYRVLLYYGILVILLALLLLTWRIVNSPFGKTLDAIGQNDLRAEFIGIPVKRHIWTVFILSGLYGGIGGGLFALLQPHVRPQGTLHVLISGELLLMALVGGFQTILGPIIGGVIIIYLLDLARFQADYYNALAGIILVAVVLFFPQGLLGSTDTVRSGARQVRENPRVVGSWARELGARTRGGVRNGIASAKHLLFGGD